MGFIPTIQSAPEIRGYYVSTVGREKPRSESTSKSKRRKTRGSIN
jgi:hypothetical protein